MLYLEGASRFDSKDLVAYVVLFFSFFHRNVFVLLQEDDVLQCKQAELDEGETFNTFIVVKNKIKNIIDL